MVHNFLGKMDMQQARMSVTDISLMFQYVAHRLNSVPYGVRNINSYSSEKMENLRQESELINFIRPADWMMFQAPLGINFRSLRDSSGTPIRDSIDKLETLHTFRNQEMLATITEQYRGV